MRALKHHVILVSEANPSSPLASLDTPPASEAAACLDPMHPTPFLPGSHVPPCSCLGAFRRTTEAHSLVSPHPKQPGIAEELYPEATISHHGSMLTSLCSGQTVLKDQTQVVHSDLLPVSPSSCSYSGDDPWPLLAMSPCQEAYAITEHPSRGFWVLWGGLRLSGKYTPCLPSSGGAVTSPAPSPCPTRRQNLSGQSQTPHPPQDAG